MISDEVRNQYTATIGIECHVQLKTATKLFAAVGNDARNAEPNTLISHICLGMPGALPYLNEAAITLSVRAALALQTEPAGFSTFDRKHYFYPDLPKGYQITQYDQPVIAGGKVDILINGEPKAIGITRAHLEEDAGKNTHLAGKDYSLVDLNRAGTPLLEIVSEPEMHSAEEAKAYAKELYILMRYADVSDADLYHGNMRFDVNVSVSKDPDKLGTRSETKNLNSFRSVEKAVEYEIDRQIELLQKGQAVVQETRGWDDAKQKTFPQRDKEEAHDYRYFPDPDLPPVVITGEEIDRVRASMPVMPGEWRKRLGQLGLDASQTGTLLEAEIEDNTLSYLTLVEAKLDESDAARKLANWFVNVEIPLRRSDTPLHSTMTNERRLSFLTAVYGLLKDGRLSSTAAKALITEVLKSGAEPQDLEKYAGEQGFLQLSDTAEIEKIVEQVIADNPKAAQDVKNSEMKAIGFLTGQVMKLSKGKANPQLAQQLLKKHLNG
jgi:aspartyl-tRNA(Asn)/glutamyl-tRNA(Gln) amidotransferase subunit B